MQLAVAALQQALLGSGGGFGFEGTQKQCL